MPSARLIDVAAQAGVSRATASRVLAGTPRNVAPELVERVERAAAELGYRTNYSARALRTGSTGTIGVIVPSLANPFFVQLIDALSHSVRTTGGVLVVSDARDDVAMEAEEIGTLIDRGVDGLVVIPVSYEASGAAIRAAAARHPLVLLDRWTRDSGTVAVVLDNDAAVSSLLDHLRAVGRRRPLMLAAEQTTSTGGERLAAFQGRIGESARTLVLPTITTNSGRDAAQELRGMLDDVDAVVCAADALAVGLEAAFNRLGVRIPADVAVTGFDDTAMLQLLDPPITSIRHPLPAMADRVIELLQADAAERGERIERFAPELVVRGSTAGG